VGDEEAFARCHGYASRVSSVPRTALVTGANRGLGLETARQLAAGGTRVIVTSRVAAAARAAAQALAANAPPGSVVALAAPFDVADADGIAAAADRLREEKTKIDVLVNNAGISTRVLFQDLPPGGFDQEIDINLRGVLHGCQAILPYMGRGQGGTIINVASAAGLYGTARLAVYSATKGAVRSLSEALDLDLGLIGIRVACLMPGMTDTPILDKLDDPKWGNMRKIVEARGVKIGRPEDLARRVGEMLETDELHYGFAVHDEAQVAHLNQVRAKRRGVLKPQPFAKTRP